jgi:hypothetical protein
MNDGNLAVREFYGILSLQGKELWRSKKAYQMPVGSASASREANVDQLQSGVTSAAKNTTAREPRVRASREDRQRLYR